MADDETKSVHDIKMEDAPLPEVKNGDGKPLYKSWKKKYRKMRGTFDQKMREGEDLHQQEQKAFETSNRIAVEIDRMLDLLLDVNQSKQIPTDRRFDLGLDVPTDSDVPFLEMDKATSDPNEEQPTKSLKILLKEVHHSNFVSTAERAPESIADLVGGIDSPAADPARADHPPTFLTADDVDNYMWEIDQRLDRHGEHGTPELLPTLAPLAHTNSNGALAAMNGLGAKDGGATASRDFVLRNPTSVYNWLRKHEPKVFLQDGESTPADKENGDDHHGGGRGRKSGGGERGGRPAGARSSKRASAAHARDKRASIVDENGEVPDEEYHLEAPISARGKRKRNIDDDPGYRPKGGSSRPTKKKRKSESGGDMLMAAKRARKSDGGIGAEDDTAAKEV